MPSFGPPCAVLQAVELCSSGKKRTISGKKCEWHHTFSTLYEAHAGEVRIKDIDELHFSSVDLSVSLPMARDRQQCQPKREKINEVSRRRGYQVGVQLVSEAQQNIIGRFNGTVHV